LHRQRDQSGTPPRGRDRLHVPLAGLLWLAAIFGLTGLVFLWLFVLGTGELTGSLVV
jgi:hypothetical protein